MFRFVSRAVERSQNKVVLHPPYAVQLEAFTLHQSLFVVDLHADALLWNRDLNRRSRLGHVDIPRLLSGNVGLQVFGVVTKMPRSHSFSRNSARSDMVTALVMAQGWPPRTWRSLFQRALYQARKLERFAAASEGKLVLVKSVQDLDALLAARAARKQLVGGFCSLEGVHALQGKVEQLDQLFETGFRMIGLTHFFDNQAGGSAHGLKKGGLTPFGREVVQRCRDLHMLIDLAHASPALLDEVLELGGGPVLVSHTGVCGTYESPRNLTDDQVRRVAAAGGVIGISMFKGALAAPRLDLTAQAMRHVANLVGVEHVGLGSDFDGVVEAPVDSSGLALLTESLLTEGFTAAEIAAIMGENALRLLRAGLPAA